MLVYPTSANSCLGGNCCSWWPREQKPRAWPRWRSTAWRGGVRGLPPSPFISLWCSPLACRSLSSRLAGTGLLVVSRLLCGWGRKRVKGGSTGSRSRVPPSFPCLQAAKSTLAFLGRCGPVSPVPGREERFLFDRKRALEAEQQCLVIRI